MTFGSIPDLPLSRRPIPPHHGSEQARTNIFSVFPFLFQGWRSKSPVVRKGVGGDAAVGSGCWMTLIRAASECARCLLHSWQLRFRNHRSAQKPFRSLPPSDRTITSIIDPGYFCKHVAPSSLYFFACSRHQDPYLGHGCSRLRRRPHRKGRRYRFLPGLVQARTGMFIPILRTSDVNVPSKTQFTDAYSFPLHFSL